MLRPLWDNTQVCTAPSTCLLQLVPRFARVTKGLKRMFRRVHALEMPRYLPGYHHANQARYPSTAEHILYWYLGTQSIYTLLVPGDTPLVPGYPRA